MKNPSKFKNFSGLPLLKENYTLPALERLSRGPALECLSCVAVFDEVGSLSGMQAESREWLKIINKQS
jgi:hypothetical protein